MKREELLRWLKHMVGIYVPNGLECGAYNEIAAILKNQPTITKKDIEGWADEARNRVGVHKSWGYLEDVMKEMLTELGVSICPEKSTAIDKEEK